MKTVTGLFPSPAAAEQAIDACCANPIVPRDQFDLLVRQSRHAHVVSEADGRVRLLRDVMAEWTLGGSLAGGLIGGLAGAGLLTLAGPGAALAHGPILEAFTGFVVGGAAALASGSLLGGIVGLGMPDLKAVRYSACDEPGVLVAVHVPDDQVAQLERALKEYDAVAITAHSGSWHARGWIAAAKER